MRLLVIAALLPLAACMAEPMPVPPPSGPAPGGDACGASGYQFLIGQPRSVLAAMTFPAPVRDFQTGDALTMDFNPNRLNIEYDRSGTIVRVFCG